MTNEQSHVGWLIPALRVVEWATIIGGFVFATVILVRDRLERPRPTHDDSIAVVKAPTACTVPGTLGTLHAYLDGAELPAEPTQAQPAIDDAMKARGAELYALHCATCHGERGDGQGPTAAKLEHPPANFTLGIFELRTTEHEALPADIDLFRTITRGVHGTAMPPWFALPERDRWAVAAHLKSLSKPFSEDQAPTPVAIASLPAVTTERIAHGRRVYETAGCASCHGIDCRGDGPAAASLVYKSGGHATPRDFRVGRFHRSCRLGDIFLTIQTGFDGTPMASFAKVLSQDDQWDVAMYVHSVAPTFVEMPGGLRCPELAQDIKCFDLPVGIRCPDPSINPDELVGIQSLMHSLHPTH